MHGSTTQRVWMADKRRVLRFNAFFFRLEYAFQIAARRRDVDM